MKNHKRLHVLVTVLLMLATLGCLAGAFVFAGISTMFEPRAGTLGGEVSTITENVGWTYYLWFIVPLLLWAIYVGYLVRGKKKA
jgi:hypothetical protein